MLYIQAVEDSSAINNDSLRTVYRYYGRDLKLKILFFADRATAEHTRLLLISGRLTWAAALARYGAQTKTVHSGVSDWIKFQSLPIDIAMQIWPLRVGQVSPIILASSGYHVVQVASEQQRSLAPFDALRPFIKLAVKGLETTSRKRVIQDQAKEGMDLAYDTTNVRYASSHFGETVKVTSSGLGADVDVADEVPDFTPQDTARVMATWKNGGHVSLGTVLHEYSDITPMLRPALNTPERMLSFIDALALAPRMVQIALARGLDKSPQYIAEVARRRESILVSHMVDDSVLTKITVTKEERRAYYDQHPNLFTSFPEVTFAMLVRPTKAAAESAKTQIAAGVPIDSMVAIDQRQGLASNVQTINDHTSFGYYSVVFKELRPGQNAVVGPDKDKLFGVIHEISYDAGKLVPYDQMESSIDESVRNIKGDAAVRAFIDLHAHEYAIESHPEMVMRVYLVDPGADPER
jgi:hypothetical protein